MKLQINIKPRIIEARTKEELIRKIRNNDGFCISSKYGSGVHMRRRLLEEPHTIRAYNIERHRPKKVQAKTKAKSNVFQGKDGTVRKTKIVQAGFWRAYVYDFKVEVMHLFDISISQNTNTFKIKQKSTKVEYKPSEFLNAA